MSNSPNLIVAHEYNVNYWVEVLLKVKLAKCNYVAIEIIIIQYIIVIILLLDIRLYMIVIILPLYYIIYTFYSFMFGILH